jgi:dTMP kinase
MLISFEGMDKSGKTTQIKLLSEYLKKRGLKVVITREPGGTNVGEMIRKILLDKGNNMFDRTELLLYLASRSQNSKEIIIPALEENKVVICDRYIDSSIVYQGFGRGIDIEEIKKLNTFATYGIIPDITFVMLIDQETYEKRKGMQDRIESSGDEFLKKVLNGYQKLKSLNEKRFFFVDSNGRIEDIFDRIKNIIIKHIF